MDVKTVLSKIRAKAAVVKTWPTGKIIGVSILSVAGLAIAVSVALGIFLSSLDVEAYKVRIAKAVKQATGRELTIEGSLSVNFFPTLGIKTGKASLSDAGSFGSAPFLTVDNISLGIGFMPLLTGDMDLERIYLHGASLKLVTNQKGEHNWESALPVLDGPATSDGSVDLSGSLKRIAAGEVALSYADERDNSLWVGTLAPFAVNLSGRDNAQPLAISGQLKDERSARRTNFDLKGELDRVSGGKLSMRFQKLEIVAKGYTGEELTVKTSGTFTYGRSKKDGVELSGFSGSLHMPAPQSSEDEPEGKEFFAEFSNGNLSVKAAETGSRDAWKGRVRFKDLDLDELLARVNPSYSAFAGESSRGAPNLSRPVISKSVRGTQIAEALRNAGTLSSDDSRFADTPEPEAAPAASDAAQGAGAAADPARTQNSSSADSSPDGAFAENAFPHVNFTFSSDVLHFYGMPFQQLDIVVHSREAKVETHCTSRIFGGSFSGIGTAEYTTSIHPDVVITGTASGIRLEDATKHLAEDFIVTGIMEASLNAKGAGGSLSELATNLKGKATARVSAGGEVRGFGMIPETAREAKYVPGQFKYDSFVAFADIADGVVSCKEVNMYARDLVIKGGGKVHFVYGQIDFGLDIIPPGKGPIPIVVNGPYRSLSSTIATRQGRFGSRALQRGGGRQGGNVYSPQPSRGSGSYAQPRPQRGDAPAPRAARSGGGGGGGGGGSQKRSQDILKNAGNMLFR